MQDRRVSRDLTRRQGCASTAARGSYTLGCRRHRLGGTNDHSQFTRGRSQCRLAFSSSLSEKLKVIVADIGEAVVALEVLNRA